MDSWRRQGKPGALRRKTSLLLWLWLLSPLSVLLLLVWASRRPARGSALLTGRSRVAPA